MNKHLSAKPLSPFLDNTRIQYAWDSTSIGYLKTCPRLYQYIMLEGWSPKEDSVHLYFGQEYHKALEEYDGFRITGLSHEDSTCETIIRLLARIRDWNPDTSTRAGNYKNPRTLLQLVIDYLDRYKDDSAKTVIRENGTAATEVSFRFELDFGPQGAVMRRCTSTKSEDGGSGSPRIPCNGYYNGQYHLGCGEPCSFVMHPETGAQYDGQPYILCGHLDRVVTFNEQTMVMDHKTTLMQAGSYFFDQWSPNNQMSLYTLAGQVILNTVIKGVIIDAAQILLDKPNVFTRGFTFRTAQQTEEWVTDLKIHLHMAEQYATIGYWPQNDTACDKFGGCKFRGVCSKDPSVRERFLEADFIKLPEEERWNPLKPR